MLAGSVAEALSGEGQANGLHVRAQLRSGIRRHVVRLFADEDNRSDNVGGHGCPVISPMTLTRDLYAARSYPQPLPGGLTGPICVEKAATEATHRSRLRLPQGGHGVWPPDFSEGPSVARGTLPGCSTTSRRR